MSRLLLLQGISGTGKTSLPLAFSQAVGADKHGYEVVEVQAGWRDRQDLLGYFNAFHRHYYATNFLQALYRAGTPAFADRPFLIILDEINLSRVEQYFADFLSALEQPENKRRLTLLNDPATEPPRLMVEGRHLPIPPNVWFVGTANHDETTTEFADKTYDRAHIMEMPRRDPKRDSFAVKERPPREPLSYQGLVQAFDAARRDKAAEVEKVRTWLQARDGVAGFLDKRFRLGWGNRLERDAERFVPVVMAAGGTMRASQGASGAPGGIGEELEGIRWPTRALVEPHRAGTPGQAGRGARLMRFRSRISGRDVAAPSAPVVTDLFDVQVRPNAPVTRLVPGGVEGLEELPFLGHWPEAIDLHAIERLTAPLLDGALWMTWVETLPLVPQIDEKAQLHPLEKEALKQLAHLQHVCHRPRLHLRVEEERLPVSQARRTPARAAAALVSHPEDWEHRTRRGIRPARILATQVEDEWNLYENRVAVRLVDHLLGWVGKRRDELSRFKSMAEEGNDFRDTRPGAPDGGAAVSTRAGGGTSRMT
ncbi:hypothetical protein [Cystobacter ferrugineus]|uniref:ATPase dynein-related AAA domain-containing protein n=1 Tax=Cystobacter ferrugineus TaxID=83449 RepID=A0A1L9AVH7_9BACT|nr:hypothetical protein [Cystobacter ferrugineus]OJH33923.1 hypothetical protein BON30_46205 [Cystobacter ferrugineus]